MHHCASHILLQGLPKSSATTQFAEDLYNRIPRASGTQPGQYQQQVRSCLCCLSEDSILLPVGHSVC